MKSKGTSQKPETRKFGAIKVGTRHRKDLGNIKALAASIKEVGLLHPIVITPDDRLIAGRRRLAASRRLGWEDIPVTVIDLKEIVKGEWHENANRKPFTPSETVAIYGQLKNIVATPRGRPRKNQENFLDIGQTRDKVGRFFNISGRTLEKMIAVVEAAEKNPEDFGHLKELMDRTGKVARSYNQLRRLQISKVLPTTGRNHLQDGKIICGDCLQNLKNFPAAHFDAVLADPDWNLGLNYTGITTKVIPTEEYWAWLQPIYIEMLRVLKPGGFLAMWHPQKHLPDLWQWFGPAIHLYISCRAAVSRSRRLPIYSAYDPIVLLWKPGGKVQYPYPRPDGMDYSISNGSYSDLTRLHPCPRPLDQVEGLIAKFVMPNALVLDCFSGSGTTALACKKLGRRFVAIEINADYCNLIQRRLEAGE